MAESRLRTQHWLENWRRKRRHRFPEIVYVPQAPLSARIVARVTLPLYLGLAAGAGILIGRFW